MITSAKYDESGFIIATIDGLEVIVPDDPENRHRMQIAAWEADGNVITPYQAPPVFNTKELALQAISDFAAKFTDSLTGPVPLNEKLSWDAKEAAAKAHLVSNADAEQTALLQSEANITGETIDDLANKIITRATLYRYVVAKVAGLRRATSKLIEVENDPYQYEVILSNAKAQAGALASELGISESP